MQRVYNFSAGPSALPEPVLEQARDELLDWHGTGTSIMEKSHRGADFMSVAKDTEQDLRDLMAIPDDYGVLFLQGGATAQFAMIPMNLCSGGQVACYVSTGAWSEKAVSEAQRFCSVDIIASSKLEGFTSIPDSVSWTIPENAAYLHYTSNETIGGVEFQSVPEAEDIPLISDMSSNILSRPWDVSKHGLIYAGAQKNMGPSGMAVVIVKRDLLKSSPKAIPSTFDYAKQIEADSMLNTPPTYTWYLLGLVLKWVKREGGIAEMERRNIQKSALLYDAIDRSGFYSNPVDLSVRSRMNVPFVLADAALDKAFLKGAEENGLSALKGHRSVGGMRASIYNAMPLEGVKALIGYMSEFERTHG